MNRLVLAPFKLACGSICGYCKREEVGHVNQMRKWGKSGGERIGEEGIAEEERGGNVGDKENREG